MRRDRKRRDDVLGVAPLVEKRALDRAPIAVQPCFHQRGAPHQIKPRHVIGIVAQQDAIVLDARGYVNAPERAPIGQRLRKDAHAAGRWIDETRLEPGVADAAGIGGENLLRRHAPARAHRAVELIDRRRRRILLRLLHHHVGEILALVLVGVALVVERAERARAPLAQVN